mmetsp:Transcript_41239/g.81383  ORF Transcript_41239/g.81383 Transcript_41239/m.81383 type:complete len:162 (-) Transcript_41239:83-568(-)
MLRQAWARFGLRHCAATAGLGVAVQHFPPQQQHSATIARCEGTNFPLSVEDLAPVGGGISIGSIVGFCAGFALKKTGKAAAIVFGLIYSFQQALAYQGYITVNWPRVEQDLTSLLDLNKDGKVDAKDFNAGYASALKVLQHNTVAISGGFGAGFLYGVKKG